MIIHFLSAGLDTIDKIFHIFFPGIPVIFDEIIDFINNAYSLGVISKMREWLGYVFYFVPWSFIKPFLGVVLLLLIIRIAMSIARVITDLL